VNVRQMMDVSALKAIDDVLQFRLVDGDALRVSLEEARQYLAARLRTQSEQQEVAEYQVRPKGGRVWRRVTEREYNDTSAFPGYRESEWDRRKLYTHPRPAAGDAVRDAAIRVRNRINRRLEESSQPVGVALVRIWETELHRAIDAAPAPAAGVRVSFPQVGIAGPFPIVDGCVTLPDATMNDLIHHARTGYVPQAPHARIPTDPVRYENGVDL
jgi:hypothetical protein